MNFLKGFQKKFTRPTVSFIGAGNMTEAILAGLESDGHPPSLLRYSEPLEERRRYMQSKYPNIICSSDNSTAIRGSDVIVLAVKPQVLRSVVTEASAVFAENQSALIISIAGGKTTDDIRTWLNTQSAIIRCMPNTPSMIGQGAVGLYATENTSEAQKEMTENIMKSIAKQVSWINQESLMDTVTAISGSGPAYFFLMMEAMQNAAVQAGLCPYVAKSLVLQTCIGAAQMGHTDDLAALRKRVTSPNGTTEAAINSLESNQFSKIISEAVFAARDREHPNKLAFEEGVGYIMNSWTALKLAVEQDWGGVESGEKREWMIDILVDVFSKRGKKTDVDEIEEILSQIMVDEFEVILEDDSPYHVAKHLYDLYNQCIQGNFTEVERLREKFKNQTNSASNCMKQDSEDDLSEDDANNDDDQEMEEPAPKEPTVDADGWETVRRK